MAPTSLYQNIIAITGQDFKPLLYVQHLTKLMSELNSSEKKSTGTTFRVSMPQLQPFMFTTDYKLSKLLLSGSQEAEKPTFMQSIFANYNIFIFFVIFILILYNRNVNSILSHPTNNQDRAKARKALAPAFSTSNLQTTWKDLRHIISAQLDYLSQLSSTDTTFNFKTLSWKLFMSSIATSGLGVKISFDGQDDENTIDGLKYMEGTV
jgi:cytochrome P450